LLFEAEGEQAGKESDGERRQHCRDQRHNSALPYGGD
jgi:hypothetical protein